MTVDEARTETPPEYRGASAAKSSVNGGENGMIDYWLLVAGCWWYLYYVIMNEIRIMLLFVILLIWWTFDFVLFTSEGNILLF